MKIKINRAIISTFIVISCIIFTAILASAVHFEKNIKITYDNIRIFVNGAECTPVDVNENSVEPFIYNGTTYVPIRAISQAFGKKVNWNENYRTIEIEDSDNPSKSDVYSTRNLTGYLEKNINVTYDNIKIFINGKEYLPVDVNGNKTEPFIYNKTVYVPIRAISQAFAKKINWDDFYKVVEIGDYTEFTEEDIIEAKKVISKFFELYSEGKYDEMRALATEPWLNNLHNTTPILHTGSTDTSKGLFGMKTAKLTESIYEKDYSRPYRHTLVFGCSFEMTPASHSIYLPDQKETSFFINVKKLNGKFLLRDAYSGIG